MDLAAGGHREQVERLVGRELRPDAAVPFPAQLNIPPGQLPLSGREADLAMLLQHFKEAFAGDRRVVLLAGEPGIGKTRLAAEAADARTRPVRRCSSGDATRAWACRTSRSSRRCPMWSPRVRCRAPSVTTPASSPASSRRCGSTTSWRAPPASTHWRRLHERLGARGWMARTELERGRLLLDLGDRRAPEVLEAAREQAEAAGHAGVAREAAALLARC